MTLEQCLDALRGYIARADRDEIGEAQGTIIAYALAAPDLAARSRAMAALQDALRADAPSGDAPAPASIQAAYRAVVDAMIDRTRDAVLDPGSRPAQ